MDIGTSQERGQPVNAKLQTLLRWEERGFGPEAVAIYGTTPSTLVHILDTGIIPPMPPEKTTRPYQKALTANGELLYYALPCTVYDSIETIAGALGKASNYAIMKAVAEPLQLALKDMEVSIEDTLALARKLIPDELLAFQREPTTTEIYRNDDEIDLDAKPEVVQAVLQRYPDKGRLLPILRDCLSRRGVILYLNKGIFLGTKSTVGNEDSEEVTITSLSPLPSSIISGALILSLSDRAYLERRLSEGK